MAARKKTTTETTEVTAPAARLTVTCLRPGGIRRAGRRWDEGETHLAPADLTPLDRARLEADPFFRVTEAPAPAASEG
ncbi:hypothetical protein RGUI_0838 [Rhodovulum sp. P5]|uniref:hypothetical protein n=1 Tax=Rhodovulum phage vB_RhkS_P1 TaxID=1873452 RepID=UPI00080ABC95|nr:hypothetical protein [Rhodovulum sp. P5]YP_009285925.1 hypothetical protein BI026_gp40 [Rhodovulum phage vB_RhkS_P1]ANT39911.1 hypothetical protein Rhks_40 [Rhodovulum phage vB_RhkS_P1]ARE38979.1 hypothetical protein RGUI_0838 [Rhodovulum sp. P5]